MRVCMAATTVRVICDINVGEKHEIVSLEELDRHIRALQKAREWLNHELELKTKNP